LQLYNVLQYLQIRLLPFHFLCNHARQRVLLLSAILSCSSVRRHFVFQLFDCSNPWRQNAFSEGRLVYYDGPCPVFSGTFSTIASQRIPTPFMSLILSELYGCIFLKGINCLTPVYCFRSCYCSFEGEKLSHPIVPVTVPLKGEIVSTLLFRYCSFEGEKLSQPYCFRYCSFVVSEGENCLTLCCFRYCSFVVPEGENWLNPVLFPVTVPLLFLKGRIVSPCAVPLLFLKGRIGSTLYCFPLLFPVPLLFLKGRIVSPCVVSYCLSVRVLPRGRVRARPNFWFIRPLSHVDRLDRRCSDY
jgi:hypothetical protein